MRATSRLLWIFFGCGLLLSGMAQARDGDKPPFHQLEFAGKTAFLMGSVHVGKTDFYPLPNQIEQAYRHAGALVLEADVRDPAAQQLLQKYGLKAATPDEETQTLLQGYCDGKPLCRQLAMMSPGCSRYRSVCSASWSWVINPAWVWNSICWMGSVTDPCWSWKVQKCSWHCWTRWRWSISGVWLGEHSR